MVLLSTSQATFHILSNSLFAISSIIRSYLCLILSLSTNHNNPHVSILSQQLTFNVQTKIFPVACHETMFTVVCTTARHLPMYWARCIHSKPSHSCALKINFKTDLPWTFYANLLHACVLHRKLREPTWIRGKSCAVEWKSATLDRPAFIDHAQKKERKSLRESYSGRARTQLPAVSTLCTQSQSQCNMNTHCTWGILLSGLPTRGLFIFHCAMQWTMKGNLLACAGGWERMLSTQQPYSCTGCEHNEIVIALQYRVRHMVHLHCCTKANNTVTAQRTVPGSPIARGRNVGRGAVRISSAFLTK